MIKGAIDDKGHVFRGEYKPHEFGKITVWQMKNLFGYREKPRPMSDIDAFWLRSRILGQSEFEIWRRWADEVKPFLEMKR